MVGAVVADELGIAADGGAVAGVAGGHGGMGKAAVEMLHVKAGLMGVTLVEVHAAAGMEIGVEQPEAIPAEGGEQKGGEGVGRLQQRQKLGPGRVDAGPLDERMAALAQGVEPPADGGPRWGCGAVVDDCQGVHRRVEAGEQPLEQLAATLDQGVVATGLHTVGEASQSSGWRSSGIWPYFRADNNALAWIWARGEDLTAGMFGDD